jgi:hypothetical protein
MGEKSLSEVTVRDSAHTAEIVFQSPPTAIGPARDQARTGIVRLRGSFLPRSGLSLDARSLLFEYSRKEIGGEAGLLEYSRLTAYQIVEERLQRKSPLPNARRDRLAVLAIVQDEGYG